MGSTCMGAQNLDPRWRSRHFYIVARERGFTKASRLLRVQQPAISRMVNQLEDHFGFKLFERVGRNVQLTPRGREVFERCKAIFEEVENLEKTVGSLSGECQGPLAIAAAEPIASHLIPEVLEPLLIQYPQLYPSIYSGPASMLLDRIGNGELEFGLFFHIPHLPPKLRITALKKIRFHLVVRKDLRRSAQVLERFIGSREIDDTMTRTFPTLEKLKKLHPKARIRISSNNLTAHHSLVIRGQGVAVLPNFLIKSELQAGKLSDVLPKEKLEFDLKLVERETGVRSLNAQTFLDQIHFI